VAKNGIDIIIIALLVLAAAGLLLFGILLVTPGVFRSKLRKFLNGAICIFGVLSPFTLFTVWAASHDIWRDYVSPALYAKSGRTLPGWYDSSVNSCHGEWNALLIAFLVILVFHVLLFVRFLIAMTSTGEGKSA
jgi:hypothetical protein